MIACADANSGSQTVVAQICAASHLRSLTRAMSCVQITLNSHSFWTCQGIAWFTMQFRHC